MIIRFLAVAAIVVSLWSLWRRVDAIIDNYQKYYDIALMEKLWDDESAKFDKEWNEFGKWDWYGKSQRNDTTTKDNKESDTDKKWNEYQKKSPFPGENKPVPMIADEFTKGYYHGLWNFFVTSGFASLFAALIFAGGGFFLIRMVWKKITDEVVGKLFTRLF
jgi:hypothetical protein